jgi:hypothetical protein
LPLEAPGEQGLCLDHKSSTASQLCTGAHLAQPRANWEPDSDRRKTWSVIPRVGQGSVTHPSPVRAQQPWMCHGWSLMALRVRNWEISAVVIESFTSCLLAKIRTEASRSACGQKSPAPVSQPGPTSCPPAPQVLLTSLSSCLSKRQTLNPLPTAGGLPHGPASYTIPLE